jgi:hypothetical protein
MKASRLHIGASEKKYKTNYNLPFQLHLRIYIRFQMSVKLFLAGSVAEPHQREFEAVSAPTAFL